MQVSGLLRRSAFLRRTLIAMTALKRQYHPNGQFGLYSKNGGDSSFLGVGVSGI
jgi:hypothetical protein